jgi:hypothetical protein
MTFCVITGTDKAWIMESCSAHANFGSLHMTETFHIGGGEDSSSVVFSPVFAVNFLPETHPSTFHSYE